MLISAFYLPNIEFLNSKEVVHNNPIGHKLRNHSLRNLQVKRYDHIVYFCIVVKWLVAGQPLSNLYFAQCIENSLWLQFKDMSQFGLIFNENRRHSITFKTNISTVND